MKKEYIDKYVDELDLLKVPDEVIIKELQKEISQLKFIIGQNESYIDELESGKIKEIPKEVEKCNHCSKYLTELGALRALRKKHKDEIEELATKRAEEYIKYKDMYYKQVEENKRLKRLLLQGLKREIKELQDAVKYSSDESMHDDIINELKEQLKTKKK